MIMKKFFYLVALLALFALNANAQSTPWKIIDMEDVSRHGGNAAYDDETLTVTFKGKNDRWIDLPGLKGDLTGHHVIVMNIEKSDVVLKIAVRYKDEEGKTKQVDAMTLYSRMGKPITKSTELKIDLLGKGSKASADILKDVVSIRVAMAKPATDRPDEPWEVQFGQVLVP